MATGAFQPIAFQINFQQSNPVGDVVTDFHRRYRRISYR